MGVYARSLLRLWNAGRVTADQVALAGEKGLITAAEAILITG